LKDTYLKYVGWSLNDKHAGVRGAALAALATLYAEEDNIAPMDTFSARFADRILQMADDVDDGVVAKALTVLTALLQAELMELDQVRTDTSAPLNSPSPSL
jgi:vesicle coat complex subunit